ncbi:MAG: response regulator transcription factor, partial [Minisyncoccia bacterium]
MDKNRILIIEDDPLLSKMYQTKLSIEGFETRAAYDGEEGLKIAKGDPPDLILLDLMLPKMDGF